LTPFSVVVPTYRRPDRLARCLDALAAQRDAGDLEVVVVEDGGPTSELESLRERHYDSIDVVWLGQDWAGPAAARNLGARHAGGTYLAFTDDDCCPRPDWIATLRRALVGEAELVAGGHTVNAVEGNVFSSASQALVSFITEDGMRRQAPFFASNNVAMTKQAFLRIGAFDETFALAGGEDRDFCDRAADLGCRFVHLPEAVVEHEHRLSARSFWRQHFNYGRGAFLFHQARETRGESGLVESIDPRFYIDLIRYPLRAEHQSRRLTTSLLLALSQVPNALGFFAERRRARQRASGSGGRSDEREPRASA